MWTSTNPASFILEIYSSTLSAPETHPAATTEIKINLPEFQRGKGDGIVFFVGAIASATGLGGGFKSLDDLFCCNGHAQRCGLRGGLLLNKSKNALTHQFRFADLHLLSKIIDSFF